MFICGDVSVLSIRPWVREDVPIRVLGPKLLMIVPEFAPTCEPWLYGAANVALVLWDAIFCTVTIGRRLGP
jgi:hypothetical protein